MSIDTRRHVTADGYNYTIVATDLGGALPYAIYVPERDRVYRLRADLTCPEDEGISLTDRRGALVRFFNVYRAADGGFVFGKRAFHTDEERRSTRDSRRAIFGLRVEYNEDMCQAKTELIPTY